MAMSAIKELEQRAVRAENKNKRVETREKNAKKEMMSIGEGAAGAMLGGVLDARYGEGAENLQKFGVPVTPLAGVAAVALGLWPKVPGREHFLETGKGILFYAIGCYSRKKFEETV